MSYSINLTNGSPLLTLADGTIDQVHTDLTLIAQNTTNYGLYFNSNFVKLLENFCNTSQPSHPLKGQLWFDSSENRLKVYNGLAFVPSGGTVVSSTAPSGIATGDLWVNNATGQLYFNDGTANFLAGPIYTKTQGQSGFVVEDVVDIKGLSHTVVLLYVAKTLIGIYAKESFVPATSIAGYTNQAVFSGSQTGTVLSVSTMNSGTITVGMALTGYGIIPGTTITGFLTGSGGTGTYSVSNSTNVTSTAITAIQGTINIGFNAGTFSGITFDVPVTQATQLLAADGSLKTAESFLSADTYQNTTTGSLVVLNAKPFVLGTGGYTQLNVTNSSFDIVSNVANQNFSIQVQNGTTLSKGIFINATTSNIGIFNPSPAYTLDITGTLNTSGAATIGSTLTTTGAATIGGAVTATGILSGSGLKISSNPPATSSATGTTGQITWDSSYVYICVATNTWKRAAISTF